MSLVCDTVLFLKLAGNVASFKLSVPFSLLGQPDADGKKL